MSKSDGYSTFSGSRSGKPPSGLFGWCCSCCFPKSGHPDCFPLEKPVVKKQAYVCEYNEVPQSKEAADAIDVVKSPTSLHSPKTKVGSVKTGGLEHKDQKGRNLGKTPEKEASDDAVENQYGIPERPWAPATKVLPMSDAEILGLPVKKVMVNGSRPTSREFENPLTDIISDDKIIDRKGPKGLDDSDFLEFENLLAQRETYKEAFKAKGGSNVGRQPIHNSTGGSLAAETKQELGQPGDEKTTVGETAPVLGESADSLDIDNADLADQSFQDKSLEKGEGDSKTVVNDHEGIFEPSPICEDRPENHQESDNLENNSKKDSELEAQSESVRDDKADFESSVGNAVLSELGFPEGRIKCEEADDQKSPGPNPATVPEIASGNKVDENASGEPEKNPKPLQIPGEVKSAFTGDSDKRRKSSHSSPPTVGLNLSVISEGHEASEDLHSIGFVPLKKTPRKGAKGTDGHVTDNITNTPKTDASLTDETCNALEIMPSKEWPMLFTCCQNVKRNSGAGKKVIKLHLPAHIGQALCARF